MRGWDQNKLVRTHDGLNYIVAKQLQELKKEVDTLIDKKKLKEKMKQFFKCLNENTSKHRKRIRFDGDGIAMGMGKRSWQAEKLSKQIK